jgi:hypothetical protein
MPTNNPPGAAMRTKAELDEQFRIVQGLQRFLGSAPILDPPIGVCPELTVDLIGNGRVAGHAFRVRVSVGLWPAVLLSRPTPGGALVRDGELLWIWIRVNEPDMGSLGKYRWEHMVDDAGRFFPEPEQTGWFQGFPVHGERVTITRDPTQPLVRPVRLDRALRWFVADRARELGLTTRNDLTSTQRRAALERQRDEATAQLATLAAADAGAPACLRVPSGGIVMFDGVVARGQPGCGAPLVEDNPELFDRRLSRSAVQVLTVDARGHLEGGVPTGERPANPKSWAPRHLLYGLDWSRVRRELMPP